MNRAIPFLAGTALAVLLPFAAVTQVGCSDDDEPAVVNPGPATLTEPEVAAAASAINSGEIAQANVALQRASTTAARDYATMMVNDHQAALDRTNALAAQLGITPTASAVSQQVQTDSDAIVSTLQAASDADFDSTYVATQVVTHTKALELLDTVLIPSTRTPQMLSELQAQRATVAMHLQEAETLMMGAPDAGPGTQDAGPGDAL